MRASRTSMAVKGKQTEEASMGTDAARVENREMRVRGRVDRCLRTVSRPTAWVGPMHRYGTWVLTRNARRSNDFSAVVILGPGSKTLANTLPIDYWVAVVDEQ